MYKLNFKFKSREKSEALKWNECNKRILYIFVMQQYTRTWNRNSSNDIKEQESKRREQQQEQKSNERKYDEPSVLLLFVVNNNRT